MYQFRIFVLVGHLCLLAGCFTDPRERAIGQAYAGPARLPLRKDLALSAQPIAELKHGERLEVLQFRRRFVKVRNLGGAEGWVESRNLLTQPQVDELGRLAQLAITLPSQGKATVFDTLNVHLEPNRQSPSPYQIAPNAYVEVVGHSAAQRIAYKSPVVEIAAKRRKSPPKKPKRKAQEEVEAGHDEEESAAETRPMQSPAMPPGPRLPSDWIAHSRVGRLPGSVSAADADDWTLVRTAENKAGWVLTRNLLMGVPDGILRLAGGHRVMAALPLGEVADGAETRNHWLWATVGERLRPYQFDSFRIFAYNLKRRRVESVFWEKDIRGFYPITLEQVHVVDKNSAATVQGFNVITEDSEGKRWKRTFAFHNQRAKMIRREPVAKPAELARPTHILYSSLPPLPEPEPDKTMVKRMKDLITR